MSDKTMARLRRLARRIVLHAERLECALLAELPGVAVKSGNDDPAPEVYVGLGQVKVYAGFFLTMSDDGLRDMIERHGRADR